MEGGGGIDRSYQKISSGRAFAALQLFAAEAGILKISIDRYWKLTDIGNGDTIEL